MVIYVDMMTYSQKEAQKYLWSKYKLNLIYIQLGTLGNKINSLNLHKSVNSLSYCLEIHRTRRPRRSEKLSRTQGFPQEGSISLGGRFHPTYSKLRGIHSKSEGIQHQGAL